MKKYIVYFEFFGKNLKTTVEAESVEKAKEKVKDRIFFYSCNEIKNVEDDSLDSVLQLFKNAGLKFKK